MMTILPQSIESPLSGVGLWEVNITLSLKGLEDSEEHPTPKKRDRYGHTLEEGRDMGSKEKFRRRDS